MYFDSGVHRHRGGNRGSGHTCFQTGSVVKQNLIHVKKTTVCDDVLFTRGYGELGMRPPTELPGNFLQTSSL